MSHDTEVSSASRIISASAQSAQSADPTKNGATCPAREQVGAQRKILRHILAHTVPTALHAPWSFLPAAARVRILRCDSPELIASFQGSFSAAELQTAGVLVPGPEDEPQLMPVLRDRLVQVVRDAGGEPVDIVSDAGALFGADPPCFEYACRRCSAADRPKRSFVAAMEDLQVLACLGFRCTPAASLADLNGEQVRRLYANLSPTSRPSYRLTLVGASIANLEHALPTYIEPILNRLHDIQVLFEYGEEADPFELWRPRAEDFDRIRAAVTFTDRKVIRNAIRDSVELSVRGSSAAWHELHKPDENDLEDAHAALRRVIAAPNSWLFGSDLARAAARLRAAIEHATTRRFLQAAGAASDPLESTALLMKSEVIQHLNQSYGPLRAAKQHDGFSFDYDPTLTQNRLEEVERGINLLLKLERLWPSKK